jgi:hypothetical protein
LSHPTRTASRHLQQIPRYGPLLKLFNYFEIYLTDSCTDDTVIGALVRTRGICV